MSSFATPARDVHPAHTTPPALERRASCTGAEEPSTLADRMASERAALLAQVAAIYRSSQAARDAFNALLNTYFQAQPDIRRSYLRSTGTARAAYFAAKKAIESNPNDPVARSNLARTELYLELIRQAALRNGVVVNTGYMSFLHEAEYTALAMGGETTLRSLRAARENAGAVQVVLPLGSSSTTPAVVVDGVLHHLTITKGELDAYHTTSPLTLTPEGDYRFFFITEGVCVQFELGAVKGNGYCAAAYREVMAVLRHVLPARYPGRSFELAFGNAMGYSVRGDVDCPVVVLTDATTVHDPEFCQITGPITALGWLLDALRGDTVFTHRTITCRNGQTFNDETRKWVGKPLLPWETTPAVGVILACEEMHTFGADRVDDFGGNSGQCIRVRDSKVLHKTEGKYDFDACFPSLPEDLARAMFDISIDAGIDVTTFLRGLVA